MIAIPEKYVYRAQLGNSTMAFETGQLAFQTDGSVIVRAGETMLLVTAVASKSAREGTDFFPLTVDYEEKLYAAGRIPGSFFRREGRPSEDAILLCRLVDRPLRPLFNKQARNEVQIVITSLSSDGDNHLDIMAVNGASAALMVSSIPWGGPIGAVRIGLINGELVVNPSVSEMANSGLDLRVAGTKDAILMVEAGADEVSEEKMLEALRLAHDSIQEVIAVQEKMRAEIGKEKIEMTIEEAHPEARTMAEPWLEGKLQPVLESTGTKAKQNELRDNLRQEFLAAFAENETVMPADMAKAYDEIFQEKTRQLVLERQVRPDGRRPDEIRPIWCDVGLLPRAHGSGVFTRGETQVLSIATLGMPDDEQRLDTLGPNDTKRYLHHYNFPPYSTGETGRMGGTKRREIGHGALAERALLPVIPPEADFPYTLRVVSEVLSSNGSTSMASVCGSTLSLMDAGVPIKKMVAGIAMGLITDPDGGRFVVLSDIQGIEDALGDMDFKVAGTREGITALQMDIKIKGINWAIFEQALAQAREGRFHILSIMQEALSEPRSDISQYAPRIITIHISPEKIGKVIGPGGKMIRAIQEETGARISIDDDGTVFIATNDGDSAALAKDQIRQLVADPEIGEIYTGKVVRATDFGLFVEILPGIDGLVHISQLADFRVANVTDVASVGDEIMVMVTDISPEGKIRLSRQAVLEGWTAEEARERDRPNKGGGGGGNRGGGDRGRGGGNRGGGGDRGRGGNHRRGGDRGGQRPNRD